MPAYPSLQLLLTYLLPSFLPPLAIIGKLLHKRYTIHPTHRMYSNTKIPIPISISKPNLLGLVLGLGLIYLSVQGDIGTDRERRVKKDCECVPNHMYLSFT